MSGGVQKRWLSVKSRIIRSYFEKKPRSRKKSKKVKKIIKLLQYDKKIHLPGEDHTQRRLISERTKDGLATARNHGRPPLQPETISVLQDMIEAGKSVSQAAKHLGISRSTAYKVINVASQRQMFAENSPLE